ncbi:MAG: CsgG/HfaB family protein [Xanthomonadales bacterium]|nr:CsgG/HfaB family protein [Xanthomonadales bacterium]
MKSHHLLFYPLILALTTLALSGIADAADVTEMKPGEGGSAVQGTAGPGGSQGDGGLEHCDRPMGALAVVEPQDYVMAALAQYNLQSPTGLIRMMVQQSNCFIVIERGQGMGNMMQERALADSGELRQNSNYGGGQMVAADFVLTPAVVFSDDNAGGIGGALGGLVGGRSGRILGGIAGGLKFKEAQTSMLVSDTRTGVQVAAAEGSAKKADLSLGGFMFGGGVGGGLGGYSSTDEGKVIAASLADNYNNIVRSVRGQPSLHRNVGTLAQEAAAGGQKAAGFSYNEGDVLVPKINNVKLLANPDDAGAVIARLQKHDEMIFMGTEQDGYVLVESGQGGGWVKKVLITR